MWLTLNLFLYQMAIYISLLFSLLFQLTPVQKPVQLQHNPKLVVTELDFGEDVITFCMHEGVKIKFKLALDDFMTKDVRVRISKGEVDLKITEETKHIYLINPRMDAFQVDVWIKLKHVKNIQVPVLNGEIAEHNEAGVYITSNANWTPISEVFPVEGEYVKVISNWKLYGRTCE